MSAKRMKVGAEKGAALLSELIALAIIAMALMVLVTGLSTSSKGVAVVDQRVVAENLARRQIELIQDADYQDNPLTTPYPTVEPVSGYTATVAIAFWSPPSGPFQTTVTASGLQLITVTVTSTKSGSTPLFVLEDYKADRNVE